MAFLHQQLKLGVQLINWCAQFCNLNAKLRFKLIYPLCQQCNPAVEDRTIVIKQCSHGDPVVESFQRPLGNYVCQGSKADTKLDRLGSLPS